MSTFDASVIKSGNALNIAQLITSLGSVALAVHTAASASLASTTSSSYSALVSKTITGVSADDVVIMLGYCSYSSSDGANSTGQLAMYANGSKVGQDFIMYHGSNNGSGNSISFSIAGQYSENLSGNIAYDLRFARRSGSGTIHSASAELWLIQAKKK